ncbi:MAG: hypothetical protein JW891_04960 [Candidatus Lokiarchaeota archaeon]|nr:hypothetical protein [Candidatus Lokiarchaeota archaeon]
MKKKIFRKKIKTDEWNERNINREEKETREEDADWNEKEDEEKSDEDSSFPEDIYDS